MALRLEDKKKVVADVSKVASSALSLVIADSRGVSVADMTRLRAEARANQVYMRVTPNNLAKFAVAGTEYECAVDVFRGPTLLGFSMEDPGAAARLFKDFAKDNDNFDVKALAVGGELLGAEQIDRLAKLPTREEALGMLAAVTLAPVTKLVRTFNDVPGRVTRVVHAVAEQKKAA
ncbi:MAG: 50S ribosomal protein L10 [Natronospirillum sp.]|uniref:50S ribosomal protein L10 n=1 Tax=Natronospirillum sp. TaxID=2812955 RepID=UPI0025F170DC|nr:50S ribosomal protein L10 [Natronospirillum sp.]MCH8553272.1 50S ribosomal protein L10 [Natronospirillum sp.]